MSSSPLLYQRPIDMFQGLWATGIMLNCNVYYDCTTGCRYCYVALNRRVEAKRRAPRVSSDDFAGMARLMRQRAEGPLGSAV